MKVLTFLINEKKYGIPIEYIMTIEKNERKLTKIPGSDEIVIGVVNIRGKICPLIDLKLLLEKSQNNIDKTKKIILIEVDENQVGLFIDDTVRIIDVQTENIETVETNSGKSKVVNQDEDLFVLIDMEYILGFFRDSIS